MKRLNKLIDKIIDSFEGMKFRNFKARLSVRHDEFIILLAEPTWHEGLGIGIALGHYDGWIGWPRG